MGIRIADWDARYEVNDSNRKWKPGDKKRKGPLEYVRSVCRGRDQGLEYRYMLAVAGDLAPAVLGVFTKLLEIAGGEPRDRRDGVVRNQHGEPASLEDLAFIMDIEVQIVAYSIKVLCDARIGWLEEVPESCGTPRESLESPAAPENPGNPGKPRKTPETLIKTSPIPRQEQERKTPRSVNPGEYVQGRARGQAASSGPWD